jgi:hypothetical protein
MLSLVQQVLSQNAADAWTQEWLEMTLSALHKHHHDFDAITARLPLTDVKQHFSDIIKLMLDDQSVHHRRIIAVLAFATYLQQRFGIDLKEEASSLLEGNIFAYLRKHKGGAENYDCPDSFHNCDWLTYSALLLLQNICHHE